MRRSYLPLKSVVSIQSFYLNIACNKLFLVVKIDLILIISNHQKENQNKSYTGVIQAILLFHVKRCSLSYRGECQFTHFKPYTCSR